MRGLTAVLNGVIEVGFYGKLPSHGDFLRRRTSDAVVSVWDAWLQDALAASRVALGERWLDIYLTSPAWRFAAAPGACGAAPIAGVMVPSVDRVGRYFPLTVIAELPEHIDPVAAMTEAAYFFDRAERLVIQTLEADEIDLSEFDGQVETLADVLEPLCAPPPVLLEPSSADVLSAGQEGGVHVPLGPPSQLTPVLLQILSHRLSGIYEPLTLWWTEGSGMVEPGCLFSKGLPHPDSFAALLDGSWSERHWWSVPAHVDSSGSGDTVIPEAGAIEYRSAGMSDVGKVRTVNQDAFLERPEVGIWVVADGLGGLSDGEVASRMVCDAFADLIPDSTFEDLIETACERMYQVNDHLNRAAERSLLGVRSGSTVAALLARGGRLAMLWAGDSRVYRWRDGRLEQLTRDHNLAETGGIVPDGEANVVTRAVGGEPTLQVDVRRDQARAGDRYLLCSDGLTRTLADERIQGWMSEPDTSVAARGLVAATLAAGAPDNVTVVLVDAGA